MRPEASRHWQMSALAATDISAIKKENNVLTTTPLSHVQYHTDERRRCRQGLFFKTLRHIYPLTSSSAPPRACLDNEHSMDKLLAIISQRQFQELRSGQLRSSSDARTYYVVERTHEKKSMPSA
jgi:hypothetical protein